MPLCHSLTHSSQATFFSGNTPITLVILTKEKKILDMVMLCFFILCAIVFICSLIFVIVLCVDPFIFVKSYEEVDCHFFADPQDCIQLKLNGTFP